jgi:hypothetical protein
VPADRDDTPQGGALVLCVGGDCRRAKGAERLRALAERMPGSTLVPCQGVCAAPMVALERAGEVRWYGRVRGDRLRTLEKVLASGRGRKRLRSSEIRKRRDVIRRAHRRSPLTAPPPPN